MLKFEAEIHKSELTIPGIVCYTISENNNLPKRIKRYCGTKKKRYEKMIAYRKECNRNGVYRCNSAVEGYYAEIGISPLYVQDEFKRIPSFQKMLEIGECVCPVVY